MKISQILILSIFLLYSKNSYSLKCYQGIYGKILDVHDGHYDSSDCDTDFCRSFTAIYKTQERVVIGACDTAKKCTEEGKVDIIMTVEQYYSQFGTSTETLSETDKKETLNVVDECCNTDDCNSKENGVYTSVPVGRHLEQQPSSPSGHTSNTIGNSEDKPGSTNSSESLFFFYNFIILFGTFFIVALFKI